MWTGSRVAKRAFFGALTLDAPALLGASTLPDGQLPDLNESK